MYWMILCTVSDVSFGNLMRFAQARQRNMWWVGATNYVMAAGLSLAWWALASRAPLLSEAALLGGCAGLAVAAVYFLMNATIMLRQACRRRPNRC